MKSELSKRIAKLGVTGFAPAEIRLGCRNYMVHDVLPRNFALRQIVVDLMQVQEGIEGDLYDHQRTVAAPRAEVDLARHDSGHERPGRDLQNCRITRGGPGKRRKSL